MSQTDQQEKVRNVVLVHGGCVDGSGWEGVTTRGRLLTKRACAMIVEVKGSHSIYVSQPQAVVTPIEQAAKGALLVGAH
jgi:hypothetical protein